MGRLFRFVVSGASIAELKDNMSKALSELNGEETTAVPSVTSRTATETLAIAKTQFDSPLPSIPAVAPETKDDVMRTGTPNAGVDARGFPWDDRIHSSNMGKNKDGSWRTKRGVEPTYVRDIEFELIDRIKSGGAAPAPTFLAPAPLAALPPLQPSAPVIPFTPVPMGNVSPQPPPLTAPVVAAAPPMVHPTVPSIAIPAAPVAPPPPIPAPVTSAHTLQTFIEQFVPTLSHLVNEGKLTPEYVAALKNYFKVEQIYQVNDMQKAEMFETFCKAGLLTKVG